MTNEGICYQRNFIKQVVFRIDFEGPKLLIDETTVKEIGRILPSYEKKIEKQIMFELGKPNPTHNSAEAPNHIFSQNKQFFLNISEMQNSYGFETNKFSSWANFRDLVFSLFEILSPKMPNVKSKRIGLRFINQIPITNLQEIKKLFSKDISSVFSNSVKDKNLSRLFVIMDQRYPEHHFKFQYGIPNQYFPDPIVSPEFVLDFDMSSSIPYNFEEIKSRTEEFHGAIQTRFEGLITDEMRKRLGHQENE